jgi:hypothetical protein
MPSGTNSPPTDYIYVILHDHYNSIGERVTDITRAFWDLQSAEKDLHDNVEEVASAGLRVVWGVSREGNQLVDGLRECRLVSLATGERAHWFRVKVARLTY